MSRFALALRILRSNDGRKPATRSLMNPSTAISLTRFERTFSESMHWHQIDFASKLRHRSIGEEAQQRSGALETRQLT
jgi:hypothetical protein